MHCRCPNCQNAIEIVDADTLQNITCPSCGSTFSLVANESAPTLPYEHQRIAHFEFLNQLGMGQFGTVWKANDSKLHRIVALKIPRHSSLSESESEKFFREARAAAQVSPSNSSVFTRWVAMTTTFTWSATLSTVPSVSEWLAHKRINRAPAAELW